MIFSTSLTSTAFAAAATSYHGVLVANTMIFELLLPPGLEGTKGRFFKNHAFKQ